MQSSVSCNGTPPTRPCRNSCHLPSSPGPPHCSCERNIHLGTSPDLHFTQTFDGVRAVLHNRLGALLEVIVIVKDNPYGSAYRSIRYCLIMESACALLGFKLGHRKDQPITIGDQSVIQADVIQYLGIGQGRTFWNFRAVHHLAVKARDFVERLSCGTRQGHQTETLNIITHMLDASLLALPCEAGSASAATTISKPDFEAKCYQALGMQAKGK